MDIENKYHLQIIQTYPNHANWQQYLSLAAAYFKETWPDVFTKSHKTIAENYDKELQERLKEGNRGLFLAKLAGECVGLANVYITQVNETNWLNIAEFYILPDKRRNSLGTQFYQSLLNWGKQFDTKGVSLEVFKNNVNANSFWVSQGFKMNESSFDKNYYDKCL